MAATRQLLVVINTGGPPGQLGYPDWRRTRSRRSTAVALAGQWPPDAGHRGGRVEWGSTFRPRARYVHGPDHPGRLARQVHEARRAPGHGAGRVERDPIPKPPCRPSGVRPTLDHRAGRVEWGPTARPRTPRASRVKWGPTSLQPPCPASAWGPTPPQPPCPASTSGPTPPRSRPAPPRRPPAPPRATGAATRASEHPRPDAQVSAW